MTSGVVVWYPSSLWVVTGAIDVFEKQYSLNLATGFRVGQSLV